MKIKITNDYQKQEVQETVKEWQVNIITGLSDDEVQSRLQQSSVH